MGWQFEQGDVVLRGSFNPYIISPEWLAMQDVWKSDDITLALGAIKEGIQFKSADVEWIIDARHLIVRSPSVDCGELAWKILDLLPHTPMGAVGCNYSFTPTSDVARFPQLGELQMSDLPAEWKPQLVKWSSIFHRDDVRITMQVVYGDQGTTVTFNYHVQTVDAGSAAAAARRFNANKGDLEKYLHMLLGD